MLNPPTSSSTHPADGGLPDAVQAADLFDTLAAADITATISCLEQLLDTLRSAAAARQVLTRTPTRTLEVALDLRRRREPRR